MTNAPPPLPAVPPLPPDGRKPNTARNLLAVLLSLCLGLFLADAVISLVDDSLILFFDVHVLTAIRGVFSLFAVVALVITYLLIGFTPMVPKRIFLPLTLFMPFAQLVGIPVVIYHYDWFRHIAWLLSICQVVFGFGILLWLQGGFKLRWPLFSLDRIEGQSFSWRNLLAFSLANVFVVLPAIVVYLYFCTALAVDHFSEGFMALHPGSITVQARKYVRADGKTIQLYPMSHVGTRNFYRSLSESFTNDSVILMEGVSDVGNLLTNKLSYRRFANSLRLAEQQQEFKPVQGTMVRADVDVAQFTPSTIEFLNLLTLIHSKGMDFDAVWTLLLRSPPPHFEEQLLEDLIGKRNRHLLGEIHTRLSESEQIVVPWGVLHMPEIAREIQRLGFRLKETREYTVFRLNSSGDESGGAGNRGEDVRE